MERRIHVALASAALATAGMAMAAVDHHLIDIMRTRNEPPLLSIKDPYQTLGHYKARNTSSPYKCSRSRARRAMEKATKKKQRRKK